jgi:alpha-beta hydrolase superfamily lysophospholipase
MIVDLLRVAGANNEVAMLHYAPRRARNVTIVAGHGYSSSKQNLDLLCAFLASHGFEVYSLDFPGHKLGASGGTLRGIEDCIDAMNAAVAFARTRSDAPLITLGHSMGAMTAVFTAALDASISGVVSIATGYGRPSAMSALRALGATDFRSSYVDGVDLPTLVAGVDAWYERLLPKLAGRPQLFVAAARDAMVNVASVRELCERAPGPKHFATIESDHTYAAEHSRGEVLQWLNGLHPRE